MNKILNRLREIISKKNKSNSAEINTKENKSNKARRNKWGFPILKRD